MDACIDTNKIPKHVALIMDGNGRWAKQRGQPRTAGHRQGVEAVRRTVQAADKLGIKYLTIFGFSTENWSRPAQEVGFLMGLLKAFFGVRLAELGVANIRVHIAGDRSAFDPEVQEMLDKAIESTRDNDGLELIVALNYGGRDEIARAARAALRAGCSTDELDSEAISAHLDVPGVPDPDLIIRTSGEQRVSNFLLWQLAYAELYFTDTLWPDFSHKDLEEAVISFQQRDRRYGGLKMTELGPGK